MYRIICTNTIHRLWRKAKVIKQFLSQEKMDEQTDTPPMSTLRSSIAERDYNRKEIRRMRPLRSLTPASGSSCIEEHGSLS